MDKNKSVKILIILVVVLVILGLVASIILVKKKQETRKVEAFSNTTIRIEPSIITGKVGETATVTVILTAPRGVNASQVKLCYRTALELYDGVKSININTSNLNILALDPKIENGCVTVYQSVDTRLTYPIGTIQLMNITFKIGANSGDLTIEKDFSKIAGEEDANGSVSIPIDGVTGAKVKKKWWNWKWWWN